MQALAVQVLSLHHLPVAAVLNRLGHRPSQAAAAPEDPGLRAAILEFIGRTRVRIFSVEKSFRVKDGQIELNGYGFFSQMLLDRFRSPDSVLAMAASALEEDFLEIGRLQEQGEYQRAVILDAVLSEKVDFGLDFLEQQLAVTLRPAGRRLGRRFSCGYGDFSLRHQAFFYQALELGRYGITLSDKFILYPEKTVTALLPIYAPGGEGTKGEPK